MQDKETAILQEQVEAMRGVLDKHLALIGTLRDVAQSNTNMLLRHLKMHKENQDDKD